MNKRQASTTSSQESTFDNRPRKRVCKACDRCRSKKAKCDGESPCSRCTLDKSNCNYGERKSGREKVYPSGYAEMLEEQQKWLVYAVQKLYRHMTQGEGWPGDPLPCEDNGYPLTHDILRRLGALGQTEDRLLESELDNTQNTEYRTSPESIDTTSETTQTVRFPSIISEDFVGQDLLAPQTAGLPPQSTSFKTESSMPQIPAGLFAPHLSLEDAGNMLPWQTSQYWPDDPFDFNSVDFIPGFDYMTTSFDEAIAPSVPSIYSL
ncbi:hypothetical protein ANOM_009412 [Aspergillus nomiae NRRL 13137]|uniref:Zn(2)-C6 fungal-type domain-containing protein n=1 Tax=Aspergillus nomiae NRRL (strain ATCC 15546 / NRRL 13137 / CBS 260.88 / M93) TaxID=1509407 RepID=A0A0L1ISE0_ASPN3|nr:uncharacterized protein ANOM_009412 [Aspergillus nomiae NRRL 13137]KNG82412.1 hypothetical protein ANOM_009412 [Aspergillus nomiae NRRL 13137]